MSEKEQSQNTQEQPKVNDKELNFRMLEAKYEKQLAQERAARLEAEKAAQEALMKKNSIVEEEEEEEPYVDKRKLKKELNRYGEQAKQQTQAEIQRAIQMAREEERKEVWLESNQDFFDVLTQYADKFAQRAPHLAKSILAMPEGFERQKLVYQNIKALGIDKPEEKKQTIQDKVDANRRGPYYQPTGVGASPYSSQSDFSPSGQKQAYEKMQELKSRLRI